MPVRRRSLVRTLLVCAAAVAVVVLGLVVQRRSGAGAALAAVASLAPPRSSAALEAPPELVRLLADDRAPAGPAPELPRVFLETAMPAATGKTITVRAGGNLQAALDAAQPGDHVVVQAGATFTGPFTLRNKGRTDRWIVVRTSGTLPPEGTRVTPAQAAQMPKLVPGHHTEPAIRTEAGAHHWRLVGLEVTYQPSHTWGYSLVNLGEGDRPQTTLAAQPHSLVLDRMYVHGGRETNFQRCIALNSGSTAIVDSWISDCHAKGNDSQAIGGWNGTGPYKIVNNHLAGAGENVMFGGADAMIPNALPRDIEIRRNHFFKPLDWRGRWTVKNSLELKAAQRVLVEGNLFENNWGDAQVGFAIVLMSINQDGRSPWTVVSDVTYRYNVLRNSQHGVSLVDRYASEGPNRAEPAARFLFEHNVYERLGAEGDFGGNARLFQFTGIQGLALRHNTGFGAHGLVLYGNPTADLVLEHNLIGEGDFSLQSADGKGLGSAALDAHAPGWRLRGNVFVGVGAGYPPPGNSAVSSRAELGFINPAAGDWRLRSTSRHRGAGADVAEVTRRTAGVAVR